MVDDRNDIAWDNDEYTLTISARSWNSAQRARKEASKAFCLGQRIPSVAELIHGLPPYRDDLGEDVRAFVAGHLDPDLPQPIYDALRSFGDLPTMRTAERLFDLSRHTSHLSITERAAWYAAIDGHDRSARYLIQSFYGWNDAEAQYYLAALVTGLLPTDMNVAGWKRGKNATVVAFGQRVLDRIRDSVDAHVFWTDNPHLATALMKPETAMAASAEAWKLRLRQTGRVVDPPPPPPTDEEAIADFLTDIDIAEAGTAAQLGDQPVQLVDPAIEAKRAATALRHPKLLVLPSIPDATSSDGRALAKSFEKLKGKPIRLVTSPDVAIAAAGLHDAWPHAGEVIDRILSDLREGQAVRIRPTLLVGEPGSGKTSLLMELCTVLGLPRVVYPCASVADGSFGGTPAQWSTRRASVPLEQIRSSFVANPAVVLDEIEKTGRSTTNGQLVHALLPMLEEHSARAYFETSLETTVNLSGVVFLATANSLKGIPDPLRDRFRVLRMPNPSIEHLEVLAQGMVGDIAMDRRLDPEFLPPLAPDELDVIAKVWGGGSLRKLRRAVEATIDVRDAVAVMQ